MCFNEFLLGFLVILFRSAFLDDFTVLFPPNFDDFQIGFRWFSPLISWSQIKFARFDLVLPTFIEHQSERWNSNEIYRATLCFQSLTDLF